MAKTVKEVLEQWDADIASHSFLVQPSLEALKEAERAEAEATDITPNNRFREPLPPTGRM